MEHLAVHDIAAYLENRLDDDARRRVEAHLVECTQCRREALEGERVLRTGHSRPRVTARRPLAVLATLAAAAVLVFAVLPRDRASDERPIERNQSVPTGPVAPAIVVVEPADSARLAGVPAAFVWRRRSDVSLYTFTLTDEQGHVVWKGSTRDTVLRLPDSLEARASGRYYWYVDALRADGGAVSSGLHGFRLR